MLSPGDVLARAESVRLIDVSCLLQAGRSAVAPDQHGAFAASAGFAVNPVEPPGRREIQDPYLREYFASREGE
jgi:hypothetical protein